LSRLRADQHSAGQALAAGVMRRNLDGSEAGKLTRKERARAVERLAQLRDESKRRAGAAPLSSP
jgi:hypothetical protein